MWCYWVRVGGTVNKETLDKIAASATVADQYKKQLAPVKNSGAKTDKMQGNTAGQRRGNKPVKQNGDQNGGSSK
jgi:hypothetical protein